MRVYWGRVFAFLLVVFVAILLIAQGSDIARFLSNIKNFGPNHSTDEQFAGMIASVIILACIVGIVRILASENHRE